MTGDPVVSIFLNLIIIINFCFVLLFFLFVFVFLFFVFFTNDRSYKLTKSLRICLGCNQKILLFNFLHQIYESE